MDAEQIAAIAEPVLTHLAAAVATIHRVHTGFCAWATDQVQPHFASEQPPAAAALAAPQAPTGQAPASRPHAPSSSLAQSAVRPLLPSSVGGLPIKDLKPTLLGRGVDPSTD